ncbi:gamma-glutamylcyclotransferase family protein [Cyclobacterium sp. 1_MG-2023]|uniref:gamma-glutamylcyclotransferase family protein n=1 Tax=Cyclobacterium sp. 1_MG-2023 TaxID=3062681 RepID=UPI0026E30B65|nr:gamma-glutamylcyclotransferase family protein [Cyclobacterium sp. 1_MG-2023]MDO6440221.1 gamma-glutamylcyclotransferase family protein [Cyclobacterium sp. 1_MG-2023]
MKHLIGGYGTLLYFGSLNKSLGRTENDIIEYIPYYVNGFQRLFNLRAPHYEASAKVSSKLIENAAANVLEKADASYNGLCFYVSDEELKSLDKRERYYDRIKTNFYRFDDNTIIDEGYIYMSNQANEHLISDSISNLLPCWSDLSMARTGAYLVSSKFGEFYDKTTFLADGKTLAVDYYRSLGLDGELNMI